MSYNSNNNKSNVNKSKIKAKSKTGIITPQVRVLEDVYVDLRSHQF